MNLAQIKTSNIPKRKLFQIERAIVREAINLWIEEKAYFDRNFAEDVDIDFKGNRIVVTFSNTGHMQYGNPEATTNELMRGLILTMVTDQRTGTLLKNHQAIIGNILDVFVHRLKELGQRKYIFQRLQSLELGLNIAFGLPREFYPIKKARRFLEEAVTLASLSTADETVSALVHDMLASEALVARERGVTFHIFMAGPRQASFISLPLGLEQTTYVPLLGTHTLRGNILAQMLGRSSITSGILKLDAPSNPLSFIRHKGFDLALDRQALMEKLRALGSPAPETFTADERTYLKLLFNEYVQLASFLLSSRRIDPGLRLLIIFPRINIFALLHAENQAIPSDEPVTIGELAALHDRLFVLRHRAVTKRRTKSHRISESLIQRSVVETISALARYTLRNIYKPLSDIKRNLTYCAQRGYGDPQVLLVLKQKIERISVYLKKFNEIRQVVLCADGKTIDIEASMAERTRPVKLSAQEEIIHNIQAAEIEQVKDVIVSKMLDYLSFVTVRIEQLDRVSSRYIKEEVVREMAAYTDTILLQARSFYRLMQGDGNQPP
jgi:hypothetical protein